MRACVRALTRPAQLFSAFVYIYVAAYHCYWAYISALMVPIYQGNYSPVSIIYNKVINAQLKARREDVAPMHGPGPHRHYAARNPMPGQQQMMMMQPMQPGAGPMQQQQQRMLVPGPAAAAAAAASSSTYYVNAQGTQGV